MTWMEVNIDTTAEAVDWVNTLLAPEPIDEIHLMPYESDGSGAIAPSQWAFTLRLYLPNTIKGDRHLHQIAHRLMSLQRTGQIAELRIAVVAEKTSRNALLTGPHSVGQRFMILPSGTATEINPQAIAPTDRIPLWIEPTQSFGSGFHPATQLCLQFLEQSIVPGMQTLDFGSGSGILTVAMAKLGAQVLALDNDPLAVEATQTAVRQNQVEPQVTVKLGSLGQGNCLGHWMGGDEPVNAIDSLAIQPESNFDVIVANVLARIHITLAADYYRALRQTAYVGGLILSGFTVDYQVDLEVALRQAGFGAIACKRQEDWLAIWAKPC